MKTKTVQYACAKLPIYKKKFFGLYKGEKIGSKPALADARRIKYRPGESTLFISTARTGKTTAMARWAMELLEEKKPFVYFLTSWHITEHSDGRVLIRCGNEEGINFQDIFLPIGEFKADGMSALIKIEKEVNIVEEAIDALQKAVYAGYHVFVDENIFTMEMLEYLSKNEYNKYTVALQSLADINGYFGDSNVINPDWIFLGRSNDLTALKKFLNIYGKYELDDHSETMRLGVGKFMVFKKYQDTRT